MDGVASAQHVRGSGVVGGRFSVPGCVGGGVVVEPREDDGGGFVEHGEGGADYAGVGFDEGPDAAGDEVPYLKVLKRSGNKWG